MFTYIMATLGLGAALSLPAGNVFATEAYTTENLPDKGQVTLSGTVDAIENEREFVLRDKEGAIDVEITSDQSLILEKGQRVTVTGNVDSGLTGKGIEANRVAVVKDFGEAVGDAIREATGISVENAVSYQISALPDEGIVKVTGVVEDVESEKEFTLKDATGSINVEVASEKAAVLTEGAEVNVVGYMDSGVLGKKIRANSVSVITDSMPMAVNP